MNKYGVFVNSQLMGYVDASCQEEADQKAPELASKEQEKLRGMGLIARLAVIDERDMFV